MSGSGPSTAELLIRLAFSLGLIVGLLYLAARIAKRNGGALKLPGFGGKKETAIKVLERQSLTKTASIAVVQIGGSTMVVGITEHGITRLADGPMIPDEDELAYEIEQLGSPTDEEILDLVGADLATAMARSSRGANATNNASSASSAPSNEAKRTLPLGTTTATNAADSNRPPRMSFVEALRELTVRKA